MVSIVNWGGFIAREAAAARAQVDARRAAWGGAKRKSDVARSSDGRAAPPGDERLRIIRRSLDGFEGFPRSDAQRRFHVEFTNSLLPHIYGADFEKHRERLLRENGMARVQFETLVCTPRRFGKTTAVSMFCAVLLAVCPDMWISVFSTGQRASSSLLEQTAKFFRMLGADGVCRGSDDNIIKKNQEELWTRGAHPADVRKMFSYPSTVAGLKGVGGRVLIMEEASRLDEAVFKEVILPLTGVQDTVLLGISTPLDESNFYSVMLDMKRPDGSPLFNVLTITLLCAACEKAGLLACPHKSELPAWKSGERQELIASLMANDRNMYIQENLGIVVRKQNSAFPREGIDRMEARRYSLVDTPAPDFLYISVDPCGGGASDMALVASFFARDGSVILAGCEAQAVITDEAQETLLRGFLTRLREVTTLRHAHVVLIIERNFGGTIVGHRIANICASFTPISAFTADTNTKLRRIGVHLDPDTKARHPPRPRRRQAPRAPASLNLRKVTFGLFY